LWRIWKLVSVSLYGLENILLYTIRAMGFGYC
jgi:hypothetical protein